MQNNSQTSGIADLLTKWRQYRAVFVVAPRGFGKTTLLRAIAAGEDEFRLWDDAPTKPAKGWRDLQKELATAVPGPCRIVALSSLAPLPPAEILAAPDVLLVNGGDLLVDGPIGQALRTWLGLPVNSVLLERSGGWPMAYGVGLTLDRSSATGGLRLQAVMEEYLDRHIGPKLNDAEQDGLAEITANWVSQERPASVTLSRRITMRLWQDLASFQGLIGLGSMQTGRRISARLNPIFFEWFNDRFGEVVSHHRGDLVMGAADQLFRRGKLVPALELLVSADLLEPAGDMLDRAGAVRVGLRHGLNELERALSLLPSEVIDRRPRLRLAQAYLISKQGQPHAARMIVQNVTLKLENHPEREIPTELRIEAVFMDALLNLYEDRSEEIKDCDGLLEFLAELPPDADFDQGVIFNTLASFYHRRGHFALAREAAESALQRYERISSTYLQIFMRVHLASIALSTGRADDAQQDIQKARSLANRHHRSDRPFHAIINVVHAQLLCEVGQAPDNAEALIEHSLPLIQKSEGWSDLYNRAYWVAVELKAARGDVVGAFLVLDQAKAFAEHRDLTQLTFFTSLARCDLLLRTLSFRAAHRIFGAIDVRGRFQPLIEGEAFWQEWASLNIIRAKLQMMAGHFGEALDILAHLEDQCRQRDAIPLLISVRLNIGMVQMALGQSDDWVLVAARTALLAVSRRLWRSVTDQGFLAENLLRCARRSLRVRGESAGEETADLDDALKILIARCRNNQAGYFPSEFSGMAKPMRCAVVTLTLNGLPAKRIAKLLGVTEPAIKYHLKEAYRQYHVHSKQDLARLLPVANLAR